MNWDVGNLLCAACNSVCLIRNFFPHRSCIRKKLHQFATSRGSKKQMHLMCTTYNVYRVVKHSMRRPCSFADRPRVWFKMDESLEIKIINLPKSENLFLGMCRNSAYSDLSSVLCNCSTSGRRVTIPATLEVKTPGYFMKKPCFQVTEDLSIIRINIRLRNERNKTQRRVMWLMMALQWYS